MQIYNLTKKQDSVFEYSLTVPISVFQGTQSVKTLYFGPLLTKHRRYILSFKAENNEVDVIQAVDNLLGLASSLTGIPLEDFEEIPLAESFKIMTALSNYLEVSGFLDSMA